MNIARKSGVVLGSAAAGFQDASLWEKAKRKGSDGVKRLIDISLQFRLRDIEGLADQLKAARFIKDTNNIPKVDSQSWDANVKGLAQFPHVIQKMNEDIDWTSDLGQAFVDDQQGIMNAVQVMRGKAQSAGSLKTTPEQVVVVTNTVVEKTVEESSSWLPIPSSRSSPRSRRWRSRYTRLTPERGTIEPALF